MDERGKDTFCKVCGDKASGKHYGVASCDGCRGFFKRSIRRNLDYVCKESGRCIVDVTRRNQCQACRFAKCLRVNMKKDAVQHERSSRNCGAPTVAALSPLVYAPHYLTAFPYLTPPHPGLPLIGCYFRSESSCNENEVTSSQEVIPSNKCSKAINFCHIMSTDDVHLTSRRLLRLAIDCADVIPSFKQLPAGDRDALLEDSWKDLFLLTMAQWTIPIEQERILGGLEIRESASMRRLSKDLSSAAAAFAKLTNFHVDHTEYACLKALVLFSPETVKKHEIEMLQEQTHMMLTEYSGTRTSKLLLILVTISRIAVSSVSQLFFRAGQNPSLIELLSPI